MDSSPAAAGSPSKGKATETNQTNWRCGWWDLYPLLERPKRPLEWSQSSIIFSAHPTQPLVTARHFSSSKQFSLPSPAPVLSSPASYDPPAVISPQPGDDWLFAYFPRRDGEGTGCLWKRGACIDSWDVSECWSFAKGGGVVTVAWLGGSREWVADATNKPFRLPPRGPLFPLSNPALLCVTQDNTVQICYVRYHYPGLWTLKRPLSLPGVAMEQGPNSIEPPETGTGQRQCLDAAIGLGYNDNSIFIATHSRRMPPPPSVTAPPFDSMDLAVSMDLTQLNASENQLEWDTWGEERSIELFEVHLRADSVTALRLTPLITLDCIPNSLANLSFICVPPAAGSSDSMRQSSNLSPHTSKGKIYLAISYVNLHEYTRTPTSNLLLYSLTQKPPVNNRPPGWAVHRDASRVFDSNCLAFIKPFVDLSKSTLCSLYVCLLDVKGTIIKPTHSKDASIGVIRVLNIPTLSDDTTWDLAPIKCTLDQVGRDLPLVFTISPNHKLVCALSSSLWHSQTSIYIAPKVVESDNIALALALSILGRTSPSDIVHLLCIPTRPLDDVAAVLCVTLDILQSRQTDRPHRHIWDLLGISTEIYRTRSLLSKDEEEVEMLTRRWQTAHDICSLAACNIAFEDCKESSGYDLEAVWHLIAMSSWVVKCTEKLMKECVLFSNARVDTKEDIQIDSPPIPIEPSLLHLSHPFTLQTLSSVLTHVRAFRTLLGSLPAGGENAHIAKDILIDVVDYSGVDLGGLASLIEANSENLPKADSDDCRRALVACQPTQGMLPYLDRITHEITNSSSILNKAALFIKPSDLVDGVARLSLRQQQKENEKDIITKGVLPKEKSKIGVCLRCGGTSGIDKDIHAVGAPSVTWRNWEKMWISKCTCGGPWLSATVAG